MASGRLAGVDDPAAAGTRARRTGIVLFGERLPANSNTQAELWLVLYVEPYASQRTSYKIVP